MGVHGLWKLIEPSGKTVPLDTLEGKVLAVDISIWLHQAIKGYQDPKGSPMPNAHLLTIYNRVCKLLYFRIKPVFVFDGGVPALKREIIAKRNQLKLKNQSEACKIQKQLINTLLKHTAVTKVLSEKTRAELGSQAKKIPAAKPDNNEDLFILPPSQCTYESSDSCDECYDETSSTSDSSPTKNLNIHDVDEKSLQFKNLPADVRHEILTDLKETRKQNSWGRIHELPKQSDDFATYQMKRLLKRYSIQTCLEEAEKEMGGATLSLNELESLMNDHGVITENKGNRIASDENTRYLYIKDVKKTMESTRIKEMKKKEEEELLTAQSEAIFQNDLQKATELSIILKEQEMHTSIHTPNTNSSIDGNLEAATKLSQQKLEQTANNSQNSIENNDSAHDKEFQCDLEAALILSLQSTPSTSQNILQTDAIHEEKSSTSTDTTPMSSQEILSENPSDFSKYFNSLRDSDFNSSEDDESNLDDSFREGQKAADKIFSAAKNYMMEYGGLTHAGVEEIFGHKQEGNNIIKKNKIKTVTSTNVNIENINSAQTSDDTNEDVGIMSESDSSSESFLQVSCENEADSNVTREVCDIKDTKAVLQIEFNTKEELVDDIFSDIFEANHEADTNLTITTSDAKIANNLLDSTDLKTQRAIEDSLKPTAQPALIQELIPSKPTDSSFSTIPKLTVDDLLKLKTSLNEASVDLMADRGTKERLAGNISDQMYNEAQDLLTLFGIPFIIAPMEAEAQCAFLNEIELTDGTITDDSDIWLFGGKTVYKNFFNHDKQVLEFRSESIYRHFKLSRNELISLAMLVGSDYTTGIQGIGPVTALEILAAFPSKNNFDIIMSLERFRDWFKTGKRVYGRGKAFLRNKLKNIHLHEGFPSLSVLKAYLEPSVETSKESFTWGKPRVDALINYTREKFGWNAKKVNDTLDPVLRRLSDNSSQKRIQDYFKTVHKPPLNTSLDITEKLSKRVQKALDAISQRGVEDIISSSDEEITCDDSEAYQVLKRTKKLSKEKYTSIRAEIAAKLKTVDKTKNVASSDKHGAENMEIKKPRLANLQKKEAIPQKEFAKNSYLQSRMKAIEVFRKSSRGPGYVKKQKKAARMPPKEDAELSESD